MQVGYVYFSPHIPMPRAIPGPLGAQQTFVKHVIE